MEETQADMDRTVYDAKGAGVQCEVYSIQKLTHPGMPQLNMGIRGRGWTSQGGLRI
jgi:hypothetical protein